MAIIKGKATKDGRIYSFKIRYTDLDGNVKQYLSKKYALKKEAQEAERQYLLTLTNKVDHSTITFKDLMLEYDSYKKDKVKITSYTNYHKMYLNLSSLNNIRVSEFNIIHFNRWKDNINKTNYSTTYKNNIYKFLRALLRFASTYLNIQIESILNKMTGFDNPNELKKEMSFWTYEEFLKFIAVEEEIKYKAFFELLYYCGLRKGEANALNWNDIDFENKTVNINKNVSLKIKGKKYLIIPPKTKGSIRKLPIPDILLNDLKKLFCEYKSYENFNMNWFIFGGIYPLADTTVQDKKNIDCKKANVKQIRVHDFRHSCASLLINNGASIALVAKFLGHSDISTTLNTYTHMFKNEFKDIVNCINNL